MYRVYRDKWVGLFLGIGLLTLVFALSAADSSHKILEMVRCLYERVRRVEEQNQWSREDRANLHRSQEATRQALERLERRERQREAEERAR